MDKKKLQAHISLLDDRDEMVYTNVRESLINQKDNILEDLEEAWELSENELVQKRLVEIIGTIQSKLIKKEFSAWIKSGGNDLIEGANIISKQKYFENDFSEVNDLIEKLKNNAWLEMHNNLTALEKVKILNHIIFSLYKFKGYKSYYNDYKGYYINAVVSRKKGSPIALSILYLSVAQELDLPIFGVDLHNNFILAYVDKLNTKVSEKKSDSILFYINPFNKGSVFGRQEIDFYLEQQKVEKNENFYETTDNIVVIRRLILELMRLAKTNKDNEQLEKLRELYTISTQ